MLAWVVLAGAQDRMGPWTIDYRTKAVAVVTIDAPAKTTSITLQNVSGRPITGLDLFIVSTAPLTSGTAPTFAPAWKPGETKTVKFNLGWEGSDWVLRVRAVLFGDGAAAGEGDPELIERMRFHRLGTFLGQLSCQAKSGTYAAAPDSLDRLETEPLETVMASLPDSPLKEKLLEAGPHAQLHFLGGFHEAGSVCRWALQPILKEQASERAASLSDWLRSSEAQAHLLQANR
jgi:hypothetical protein